MKTFKSEGPYTQTEVSSLRKYNSAGCVSTGSSSIIQTGTHVVHNDYFWTEGATTPGWRKISSSGKILPMTSFRQYKWEYDQSIGSREYCNGTNRFKWENAYGSPALWLVQPSFEDLQALLPSFDLSYYVQQSAARISASGYDALTALLELKQTLRMITGILGRLQTLTKGLTAREIANAWLEGRYGWRTLRYDLIALSETLENLEEKRTRYKERSGLTTFHSLSSTSTAGTGSVVQYTRDITIQLGLRGSVIADIEVPKFRFSPLSTAWEVTRLSFVVDWLLNIGQALSAFDFVTRVDSYAAAGGYRAEFSMSGEATTYQTISPYTTYSNSGSCTAFGYIEQRVPMAVSFKPKVKLRLDTAKVFDLIALIAQRILRR